MNTKILTLIALSTIRLSAQAFVAFDNTGGQTTFNTMLRWSIYTHTPPSYPQPSYEAHAVSFSLPVGDYYLDHIGVPIFYNNGAQNLGVYLYSDIDGLPGTMISQLSVPNYNWPIYGSSFTATNLSAPSLIMLHGTERYWILAKIDVINEFSEYTWATNGTTHVTDEVWDYNSFAASPSGTWTRSVSYPAAALSVSVASIPEPSTYGFIVATGAFIITIFRRNKRALFF